MVSSPTVKGTFSFRIPFKHIFGFREDYDKIVYGLKHTLSLVRKTDNDAIFRNAAADVEKVTIDKSHGSCLMLYPQMLKIYQFTRLLNQRLNYQ